MMRSRHARLILPVLALVAQMLLGCKHARPAAVPDYNAALPPGAHALRKITNPADLPSLAVAFQGRDADLEVALERSVTWFGHASTRRMYPISGISHEQARASAYAFVQILRASADAREFQQRIYQEFDAYVSIGWNGQGVVQYTGYFTPIFDGSREPTPVFRYALYTRPADLASDERGNVLGRKVGDSYQTYPTRSEIEMSATEPSPPLVYLRDQMDAYIIHVNGSAQIMLPDGSAMHVGYAGNNGHPYTSIGRELIKDGKIDRNRLSLASLRQYFRAHPQELDGYIRRNQRYVFFTQTAPELWPAGALGFKVTPYRSLATDKKIFPAGSMTLVKTRIAALGENKQVYEQFMLDQDAGGAIQAPGRADIYMGIGPQAEQRAGRQFEEGRLYYFFLKPQRVQEWLGRMAPGAVPAT